MIRHLPDPAEQERIRRDADAAPEGSPADPLEAEIARLRQRLADLERQKRERGH
ncbi:MAG TPA: hypothetical protein VFA26_09025 [Gemmataceae bacterium]|nr:hypothetical protein [Gemmataceae bacterium]